MNDDRASSIDTHVRDMAAAQRSGSGDAIEQVSAFVERIHGFSNRGQTASGFTVGVDEPREFGGTGLAPDPAELLLVALGASLLVTLTVRAALAGIAMQHVAVKLTGKLDADRFFAPTDLPGGGFFDLVTDVSMTIDGMPADARSLLEQALLASPVYRSIEPAPTVRLTLRAPDHG